MLRTALLVLLSLSCAASAVEPALRVLIPDAQRFQTRLAAGPLGPLLAHPALAAWLAQHGGPGVQAVRRALAGATQIRVQVDRPGRQGGLPSARATLAAVAAVDAAEPVGLLGMHVQRSGAWHMLGWPVPAAGRPEPLTLSGLLGGEDLLISANCPAWTALLPARQAAAVNHLAQAWKLGEARLHLDLATRRGALLLPAAQLPLRPIERSALAGLSMDAEFIVVLGLAGEGWPAVADDLCWALGVDPSSLSADARLGAPLADLLTAVGGTVWATCSGPAGDLQVSLPAHPTLLAALQHWVAALQPEPGPIADEAAQTLVQQSREQAIALPFHGRVLFVRLAHERIWLATAGRLLDALQAEALPVPDLDGWAEDACLQVRWNSQAAALLAGAGAQATPWHGLLQAVASAGLPGGWLELRPVKGSIQVTGEVGLTMGAALLAALPTLSPGWLSDYAEACIAQREAALRQVLARARAFAKATSGHWPRDLDDLRARAADLGEEVFGCAGRPDLARPFAYVQPMVGAPDEQPVLVQDPAVNDGRGGLVGFADGRVEFRVGQLYWSEANRLLTLPSTLEQGAAPSDWATMPKVF
jgi:hypothetical protein